MPFPIDLQKNMARTQCLVKNSDFFTNGLILVIHIIYQLLVMIWKLLHHLKHPSAPTGHNGVWPQGDSNTHGEERWRGPPQREHASSVTHRCVSGGTVPLWQEHGGVFAAEDK